MEKQNTILDVAVVKKFGWFWCNKAYTEFETMCKDITPDELMFQHVWGKCLHRLENYSRIEAGYQFFFDLDSEYQAKVCDWITKNYNC